LIQNAIPNATVAREFTAEGVVCTIEVPLSESGDNGASSSA
jgi:hypothetical protein